MHSQILNIGQILTLIVGASALPSSPPQALEARDIWSNQASTLGIFTYAAADCVGDHVMTNPVIYGHDHEPGNFTSVRFNRDLKAGEELDFSSYSSAPNNYGIDKACAQVVGFVYANTGPSKAATCTNLKNPFNGFANCFRLWHS